MLFQLLEKQGQHEQVIFCNDKKRGLKAIIAIHNTNLGPALGGCRMHDYKSEEEAIKDVLNLSRAMSYKASVAGVALGGGKSVIIGNPDKDKSKELFQAFGSYVESLKGRYIVAKDAGMTVDDLQEMSLYSQYVIGRPKSEGGVGDPSSFTALGVFYGMKEAVRWKLKKESLENLKVVVQGAGSVGRYLIDLLVKEGARVFVSDIKATVLDKIKATYPSVSTLKQNQIFSESCDIFSPCALGGVMNEESLKKLNCSIIAGGANNVLENVSVAKKIQEKGILYVPDFVLNSGGLIYVFAGLAPKKSKEWVESKIKDIGSVLLEIFKISEKKKKTTVDCAIEVAQERIRQKGEEKNDR